MFGSVLKEIKYECDKCNYKATLKGNLKKYIENIHLRIRHECIKCEKTFSSSAQMSIQMKSVHENVRYPCNLCDYRAIDQSTLNSHTPWSEI